MPQDLHTSPQDDPDFFYWTIRIGVHKDIVADGFNFANDQDGHDWLANVMPWVYGHELSFDLKESPDQDRVAKEQGYKGKDDPRFKEN